MIPLCRRFVSLDRTQRGLVIEAAMLMLLGWVGLRLLRFPTLRCLLDHVVALTPSDQPAAEESVVAAVHRAVIGVAARCPAATCLVRALAADVMLRRRRVSCVVRFGVRFSGLASDVIEGHAWVECRTSRIDAIDGPSEFSVLTR
jgi:Transglutaminase-like superfamily